MHFNFTKEWAKQRSSTVKIYIKASFLSQSRLFLSKPFLSFAPTVQCKARSLEQKRIKTCLSSQERRHSCLSKRKECIARTSSHQKRQKRERTKESNSSRKERSSDRALPTTCTIVCSPDRASISDRRSPYRDFSIASSVANDGCVSSRPPVIRSTIEPKINV